MTPIARAAGSPRYKRIIAVLGSQMGKTEGALNIIGWRLDDDPTPTLYIGPTQKQVESMSSDRVIKMLRSVPSLWDKLEKGKRNKIGEKFIAGVRFGFAWAGSATELASHPAGLVLVDERDRMENDVAGEGDPVELAEARISTYPDGKLVVVSTPTKGTVETEVDDLGVERFKVSEVVESPIWKLWQEGTRFEWAWPCPDCGEYFVPRFRHLWWPKDCTASRALKEARMVCPHCGVMIEDIAKQSMNARGVYVAPGQTVDRDGTVNGDAPDTETASFWVSGLCSPWRSFGQRARAFISAVRSGEPTRVQTVVNTGFGELFATRGDAPAWSEVAALKRPYEPGTLPAGVQVLTCGVDVQKNRLVYAIRGWGHNYESWLIEHGELWGETKHDAVWESLDGLLAREIGGMQIMRMGIDSGYKPGESERDDHQVYLFCRRNRGRALATKGHDKLDRPFKMNRIDVSHRGKVLKNGVDLWHFDTDFFKTWVHTRLEWPEDKPGGFHLHRATTDDYCQQLVAEHRVVKPSGQVTWVRVKKDNHMLDCETNNALMAHVIGVHTLPKEPSRVDAPVPQSAAPAPAGFGRGDWNERF
jgi:phage terminase large subunit GpA-like protein